MYSFFIPYNEQSFHFVNVQKFNAQIDTPRKGLKCPLSLKGPTPMLTYECVALMSNSYEAVVKSILGNFMNNRLSNTGNTSSELRNNLKLVSSCG